MDKEEVEACEKLVHDQHLQQQGWAAVVANLEDITRSDLNARDTYYSTQQNSLLFKKK